LRSTGEFYASAGKPRESPFRSGKEFPKDASLGITVEHGCGRPKDVAGDALIYRTLTSDYRVARLPPRRFAELKYRSLAARFGVGASNEEIGACLGALGSSWLATGILKERRCELLCPPALLAGHGALPAVGQCHGLPCDQRLAWRCNHHRRFSAVPSRDRRPSSVGRSSVRPDCDV